MFISCPYSSTSIFPFSYDMKEKKRTSSLNKDQHTVSENLARTLFPIDCFSNKIPSLTLDRFENIDCKSIRCVCVCVPLSLSFARRQLYFHYTTNPQSTSLSIVKRMYTHTYIIHSVVLSLSLSSII